MNVIYNIPINIMAKTKEFLVSKGKQDSEGYILWKGIKKNDTEYQVTGFVIPEQVAIKNVYGYAFDISARAIEKVTVELFKNREIGLIQVHSHPSLSTIHSQRDNTLSLLSRKGAISVVVPHFGNVEFNDFSRTTVYMQTGIYKWDIVPKNQVSNILRIVR